MRKPSAARVLATGSCLRMKNNATTEISNAAALIASGHADPIDMIKVIANTGENMRPMLNEIASSVSASLDVGGGTSIDVIAERAWKLNVNVALLARVAATIVTLSGP